MPTTPTTLDAQVAALTAQIATLQAQLEALTDAQTVYPLNLGSGPRTVHAIDLTAEGGIKLLTSDNIAKLTAPYYLNYAGFTADEEDEARTAALRLIAWLKFRRVHEYLQAQTAPGVIANHVVRYDPDGDTFVAVAATADEAAATGEFLFRDQTEAESAITYMLTTTSSDAQLRELFGVS